MVKKKGRGPEWDEFLTTPEGLAHQEHFVNLVEEYSDKIVTVDRAIEITPDMAANMLLGNNENRLLDWSSVEKLERAIDADRYHSDGGDTIVLTDDGQVVDGQHRLTACVKSGKPIKSLVVVGGVHNLDIDTGKLRSFNDILKFMKHDQIAEKSGVVKNAYLLDEYGTTKITRKVANEELYDWLMRSLRTDDNPLDVCITDVFYDMKEAYKLYKSPKGTTGAFFHRILREDKRLARNFIDGFLFGDLKKGDPRFAIRERLENWATTAGRKTEPDNVMIMALFILSWNHYVTRQRLKQVQWRYGGNVVRNGKTVRDPGSAWPRFVDLDKVRCKGCDSVARDCTCTDESVYDAG